MPLDSRVCVHQKHMDRRVRALACAVVRPRAVACAAIGCRRSSDTGCCACAVHTRGAAPDMLCTPGRYTRRWLRARGQHVVVCGQHSVPLPIADCCPYAVHCYVGFIACLSLPPTVNHMGCVGASRRKEEGRFGARENKCWDNVKHVCNGTARGARNTTNT